VIAGIVLAAGGSTRFGAPKLLARLGSRPLLEHALVALAAAPLDRRFVVLGAAAEEILAEVNLHGAEPVRCERWHEGQALSLRAGIAASAAADAEAAAICLGDQPLLSPLAFERVLDAWRASPLPVARAAYEGEPGHPVVVGRALFSPIGRLSGDAGARDLLDRHGVLTVPCDDLGSPADVDTEDDLRAIRAAWGSDE
jgi:CTP:molybdopterin cytidylyltransferase MocA